jgi:peptide chain release factor 3
MLDEVEEILKIRCAPITWPIGMGRELKGVYHLDQDFIHFYDPSRDGRINTGRILHGLRQPGGRSGAGRGPGQALREEIELVRGASHAFDVDDYRAGRLTPVFFGSALTNFGVQEMLDGFVEHAPPPRPCAAASREVAPEEEAAFTGFVFKIQANMDPQHRDRIAFLRVCSGSYQPGMKAAMSAWAARSKSPTR